MMQKTNLKLILCAGAAALTLAASASAQNTTTTTAAPAETAVDTGRGLLGQRYFDLGYRYDDVHHSSTDLQALGFEYNQPVTPGFDVNLAYTGARSSEFDAMRQTQQSLVFSAVGYMSGYGYGRPYLSAGGGWLWLKTGGDKGNSFLYQFETGVEWPATRVFSLTPFVRYVDAPSVHLNNHWNYGLKANYWLTDRWAINGLVALDNKVDATYGLGVALRF